ncbi:MAG TPA: 23S rRNA (adenine(2030)-N(6))-methyltransferase RlmJ [Accumulibacter sp.]|uniref:23S rRNA (adenine(2030)-N(6))-methyltransferase RlmJ n=1 Tax=Accumulibacter sp. TaxID=2053492 RepID=UPI002B603BFE|nr:23S rRNA (adenine(2030)-N(6))-methyltransferase RlmJ [Accumulibacter sp.]HRD89426.1 23S rRNA (adenine(2030)-N(6))-methyltransferase RlmJ [Accumulibacter sp.]
MLSYRHAFHAGNHADVLKHLVLVQLTRYLGRKDKAFWYIDSHAGAGSYALESAQAAKLAEYRQGIARLWGRKELPPAVADYVDLVRRINPGGGLKVYPGSPDFALWTMRAQDRMRLFELHSRDVLRLREHFASVGARVLVDHSDGFAGLKALLPPPCRRALVLIDPAYEEKHDYQRVIHALRDCLQRFPGGTYLLWYPQLTRLEAHDLPPRLKRLPASNWLHVALRVRTPDVDGFGMHGSGLFVINPPWTLQGTLQELMPWLVAVLGSDEGAGFTLESQAA